MLNYNFIILHVLERFCADGKKNVDKKNISHEPLVTYFNPYPTAFPYGNGTVLHFYQQQESRTTKTVHKVINKGLKAYV